jgi:hypothetical protein
MSATFADVSANEDSEDLVVVDTGSTVSILGSNFTSNSVTSAMLVLRSNGTAIYEQITFTKNKGGTSEAGMLQSVEGSTLSLKRVDAISNTFDVRYLYNYVSRAKKRIFLTLEFRLPVLQRFAISSGESSLTSRFVFVKGHEGLSQKNFTEWEVFSITNQSSLTLSDSSINATEAYVS